MKDEDILRTVPIWVRADVLKQVHVSAVAQKKSPRQWIGEAIAEKIKKDKVK